MSQEPLRLLIAYDGSPSAATAMNTAASLFPTAHAYIATVPAETTLHAGTAFPQLPGISPPAVHQAIRDLRAEAQQQADETAEQAAERARALGLQAEPVPIPPSASPSVMLLETAGQLGADVLACGTRGRGPFTRALLGSTSSSLVQQSEVPLLVVPDARGTLDGPTLVAYDGSDGAKHAIQVVGRLLSGRPAVLVHAWQPTFQRTEPAPALRPSHDFGASVALFNTALADQARQTTEEGLAVARSAGLDAVGDTEEASEGAWRGVAAAARTHRASVIAVGRRGLGAPQSVLLGSTSRSLVHNAELPILIVPDRQPPVSDASGATVTG